MDTPISYERLLSEHARIDTLLDRLRALVMNEQPRAAEAVLMLSDLSCELMRHLEHEDSLIYPRMIAGSDRTTSEIARRFVQEFADLRADWAVYLGEWNTECIVTDWQTFCRDSIAMISRLSRRVRAENELLYTAALASGALPLRDRRRAA